LRSDSRYGLFGQSLAQTANSAAAPLPSYTPPLMRAAGLTPLFDGKT